MPSQFKNSNSKYNNYYLRQEVLSNFGNVISCANYFTSSPATFLHNYSTMERGADITIYSDNEFINLNLNDGSEIIMSNNIGNNDGDFHSIVSFNCS